jgi:hypothetical protein
MVRDTVDGKFHLSLMAEDHETRLKLKSIVRVLQSCHTLRAPAYGCGQRHSDEIEKHLCRCRKMRSVPP